MSSSLVTLTIKSGDLDRFMAEAPKKTKKALKEALQESSLLVMNEAKKNAPNMRGDLKRSITREVSGSDFARIGTDKIYARIQEEGGTITAKGGGYLTFKIGGQWVRVKQVRIPAQPYLGPALKDNESKIEKIFAKSLERNLQ